MLTAIGTRPVVPVVRVPWLDPGIIMKSLDAGALGVICPMINNAEEAQRFVASLRYPPLGVRSFGPIRAFLAHGADYPANANDLVTGFAMIETKEALAHLDEIMSVPGLDAIYIGPTDLALALGAEPRLDPTDPRVTDAIAHILARAKAHGLRAGIHNASVEHALKMVGIGFDFVTAGSDARFVAAGAAETVSAFRAGRGEATGKQARGTGIKMTGELSILATGLKFPEGPVAHADGSVSLVEIQRGTISRVTPDGAVAVVAETGGGPNGPRPARTARSMSATMAVSCSRIWAGFNHTRRGLPPVSIPPAAGSSGSIPKLGAVKRLYDRCGAHVCAGPNDLVLDGHGGLDFIGPGKTGRATATMAASIMTRLVRLEDRRNRLSDHHAERHRALAGRTHGLRGGDRDGPGFRAFDLENPGQVRRHPTPRRTAGGPLPACPATSVSTALASCRQRKICVATLVTGCITIIAPDGAVLRQVMTGDPMTTRSALAARR